MEDLSTSFVELEKTLGRGSIDGVEAAAQAIAKRLSSLAPDSLRGETGAPGPEHFLRQAVIQARALAGHAAARHPADARVALERVRMTCVACHANLRDRNEARGWFPARGNTVWGRVEVQDAEGRPRPEATVVVFIDVVPEPDPTAVPGCYPRLSQQGQKFSPRVLPVVVGTEVEFPNDDVVFHNVFSLSKTQPFDLGVYGKGKTRRVEFTRTGLVRLYCNIHPNMSASILVLANAHFAVTDSAGNYVITGIPDGNHTLRSWHELGGGASHKIEFAKGRVWRQDFVVRETRKRVPHKNKFGKPYRSKY